MYAPVFHLTNNLVRIIGSIEASLEVIKNKELIPETESQLMSEASVKRIYFGTHIEGNELTLTQTSQILEGATSVTQNMDVQEVINFKRAINLISELSKQQGMYLEDWLRDIHSSLSYNILPPDKAGFIRTTQVVIRDQETNEVILTPPPAIQVPILLNEFFAWLNSPEASDLHPIIKAAIAHTVLVQVHPFVEANAPVVRMFVNLILEKEGYSARNLLSFEEKIDENFDSYFDTFFNSNNEFIFNSDITSRVEIFSNILASAYLDVKNRFREMKEATPAKFKVGEQVALSSRQMKLLEYISENGRAVMKDLKEVIPSVSDDTILRDLTALSKKGIIEKEGTTKASSYILKK